MFALRGRGAYNQSSDEYVLLGNLSVWKDCRRNCGHVVFIRLTKRVHALVIWTYKKMKNNNRE